MRILLMEIDEKGFKCNKLENSRFSPCFGYINENFPFSCTFHQFRPTIFFLFQNLLQNGKTRRFCNAESSPEVLSLTTGRKGFAHLDPVKEIVIYIRIVSHDISGCGNIPNMKLMRQYTI